MRSLLQQQQQRDWAKRQRKREPVLIFNSEGDLLLACAQALLEDHGKQKELREKREREKRDKELRKLADLEAARSEDSKRPGYQRLRANQVCYTCRLNGAQEDAS